MKLVQLQQQLIQQLEHQSKGLILQKEIWNIPAYLIKVTYKPVIRSKMDILMKIMLISFQKGNFENAKELSEILQVEQLFIQDLMTKMIKTGIIERVDHYFKLTEKGNSQFSKGIFEEEQEANNIEFIYSPLHDIFLDGDLEEATDFEDFPDIIYRYNQPQELNLKPEKFINEICSLNSTDSESEEKSTFNVTIESIEQLQIYDIPCLEFLVYEKEKDHLYTRVWNTFLDTWDETVEKELEEKELPLWRNKFLS